MQFFALGKAPTGTTDRLLDAAIALVSSLFGSAEAADLGRKREAFAGAYRRWIVDHSSVEGSPDERMEKVRLVTAAASAAPDLRAALDVMLRFGKLVTPELSPARIDEHEEEIVLVFDRPRRPGAAGLISDLWPLALLLSQLECLAGRPLGYAEASVRHHPTIPAETIALFFDQPVLFARPELTLRLPKRCMHYAVVASIEQASSFQPRLMPVPFSADGNRHDEFTSLLKGILRLDRMRGMQMSSFESVAVQLGCSPATLRRRLAREGTTFQRLRDGVNNDQAKRWLLDGRLALGSVAERLGFSDAFSFARFFQRLNGCTPAAYRKRHRLPGMRATERRAPAER